MHDVLGLLAVPRRLLKRLDEERGGGGNDGTMKSTVESAVRQGIPVSVAAGSSGGMSMADIKSELSDLFKTLPPNKRAELTTVRISKNRTNLIHNDLYAFYRLLVRIEYPYLSIYFCDLLLLSF